MGVVLTSLCVHAGLMCIPRHGLIYRPLCYQPDRALAGAYRHHGSGGRRLACCNGDTFTHCGAICQLADVPLLDYCVYGQALTRLGLPSSLRCTSLLPSRALHPSLYDHPGFGTLAQLVRCALDMLPPGCAVRADYSDCV